MAVFKTEGYRVAHPGGQIILLFWGTLALLLTIGDVAGEERGNLKSYQALCSEAFRGSWAEEFLASQRGITAETASRFGVGYDQDQDCIVFPYYLPDGSIHRFKLRDKRGQRYSPGEGVIPFGLGTLNGQQRIFSCEGETDTLRLAQELPDEVVIGIPGAASIGCIKNHLPDEIILYTVFDSDKAGKTATAKAIEMFGARPVILPEGIKDVCEFFQAGYDREDFMRLVATIDNVHVETSAETTTVLRRDISSTPSTQSTQSNVIQLRPWCEVVYESVEDREWLLEGILPKTGLAILGGWAKAGKSTLAIHLCREIAEGKPFLGRTTVTAPVIYINYEMPEDYRSELIAAGQIPDGAFWLDRPVNVLDMDTVREVIDQAGSDHGLLVIDSFRGAFRITGDGENSAGNAGVILRDLQRIAIESGWLILLIHHNNKGKKQLSGTGDFYAAADVLLNWKRTSPNSAGELTVEGRMAPVEPMAMSLTQQEATYLGEAKDVLASEDLKRVLESITDEPISAPALAKQLAIKPGSIRAYLSKLFNEGKIDRQGEGKRGDPFLYSKTVESVDCVSDEDAHNTKTKVLM